MNEEVMRDFFLFFTGKELGAGISRRVYEAPTHKGCVVKVESETGYFANVNEWTTWQHIKDTEFAKWFAPCEWISPHGTVLIQRRTQPITGKLPTHMPVFLTDLKRDNFGRYNGNIVCHDYGSTLLLEEGMSKRMKKAWWHE